MNKIRTNSVPNTFAQINHLCSPGNRQADQSNRDKRAENNNKNQFTYVDVIIDLQKHYGLRISEVLNIKGTDISKNNHIHIRGLKRSNDRIIAVINYQDWWKRQQGKPRLIFDNISRYTIYREYKKRGIGYTPKGNKKQAVTHSFRHKLINELRKLSKNEQTVSNYTGHKSTKNTQIYGKE